MSEVTEVQLIVVALDEAEVEFIGMFLRQWKDVIDLDGESDQLIKRVEELVRRLKNKLQIDTVIEELEKED